MTPFLFIKSMGSKGLIPTAISFDLWPLAAPIDASRRLRLEGAAKPTDVGARRCRPRQGANDAEGGPELYEGLAEPTWNIQRSIILAAGITLRWTRCPPRHCLRVKTDRPRSTKSDATGPWRYERGGGVETL